MPDQNVQFPGTAMIVAAGIVLKEREHADTGNE